MLPTEENCPTRYDASLAVIPKPHLDPLPEFGKQMRSLFAFDPNYLIFNNASFGSLPKYVTEYFNYYSLCSEFHPDRWMNFVVKQLYLNTLERFSPYLGCKDPTQLAFTANTTTSLNSVLRSFEFNQGDVIFKYSTTYGGCSNAVSFICDKTGATSIDIPLVFPCTSDDIIEVTKKFIKEIQATPGKRIRFAIVDAISALPNAILPYKKLVSMFKDAGARVFLDAAQALGQIEIEVDTIGCDYMSVNAHKWLYTKRGCAILYVSKEIQSEVHPTTISWPYKPNLGWNQAFFEQGVSDYSGYLTLNPAMDFMESAGGLPKIRQYTHKLAIDGMNLLKKNYNLEPMTTDESQISSMFSFKLPLEFGNSRDDSIGANLSKTLLLTKNASGVTYSHNNVWWMRVTTNIFLDLDDFNKFGKLLIETIAEEKTKPSL